MSASICFVVGARPNFMKAAPVHRALQERDPSVELLLVHTGQHYDPEMSAVFLDELGLPAPDVFLGVGSGRHGEQTARALAGIEEVLLERRPDVVVVSGDVNSTLSGALAAAKLQIPVAHLEAGLRSYDRRMPEEHNRVLTDHLSSILLAHSASAIDNLAREGIDRSLGHLVGNTMIDSLLAHVESARAAAPWEPLGLSRGEYALVTLHRPAVVDDPQLLARVLEGLMRLAAETRIVFPVHPRTRERLSRLGRLDALEAAGVTLTGPLGYLAFLGLEAEARYVLTDSGGVQEETSALGVPCFTFRDTTERPITVELGTNTVLGTDPEALDRIPSLLAEKPLPGEIPLWDGHAGPRAAEVLLRGLI